MPSGKATRKASAMAAANAEGAASDVLLHDGIAEGLHPGVKHVERRGQKIRAERPRTRLPEQQKGEKGHDVAEKNVENLHDCAASALRESGSSSTS